MSRTDKDRPWRVQQFDPSLGSYIEHDHRFGECRVETPDNLYRSSWRFGRHHYRNCSKILRGVSYCTKKNPHTRDDIFNWCYNTLTGRACWTYLYDPNTREYIKTQCQGRKEYGRDESIPCVCDDFPEYPTCDVRTSGPHGGYWRWQSGVPKWYTDHHWNNPERVRERDELKKAAALYNAGGWDEDDEFEFDFPNYQHRRSAAWHYH